MANQLGSRSTLIAILVTTVVAIAVVYLLTGFPNNTDYSRLHSFDIWPDVLHERAIALESLIGDPHRPVSEIMAEHGFPEMVGGPSPRTPAAVLFQAPLLLIPEAILMPVVTLSVVGLTLFALWLTSVITGVDWRRLVWVAPLLLISYPVVTSISYGSISVMVTVVLILTAWAFRDRTWSGVPLGLAAAIRLWPALIIVGFWIAGRRRAAYLALAVLVMANVAGLLLPGVTVEGSLASLIQGGGDWMHHTQNSSMALVFDWFGLPAMAATGAVSLLGLLMAVRNPDHAIPICLVTALLASPLSWPTYMLAALPVVIVWWRSGGRIPVAVLSAPLIVWMYTPNGSKGYIGLAILVSLLAFASFSKAQWKADVCTAT
jgi:hypothetical protein